MIHILQISYRTIEFIKYKIQRTLDTTDEFSHFLFCSKKEPGNRKKMSKIKVKSEKLLSDLQIVFFFFFCSSFVSEALVLIFFINFFNKHFYFLRSFKRKTNKSDEKFDIALYPIILKRYRIELSVS